MNHAHARADGSGVITLDGQTQTVQTGSLNEATAALLAIARQRAAATGVPVELIAQAADQPRTGLRVTPTGEVIEDRAILARRLSRAPRPETGATPAASGHAGRVLGIAAASMTGILLVGGLGYAALTLTNEDAQAPQGPSTTPSSASSSPTAGPTVYVPTTVPKGWAQQAVWADDLAEGTYPVVTLDGYAAHITPYNTVKITNPHDGQTLVTSEHGALPAALVTFTEPAPGVAWLVEGQLHTWTAQDGEKAYPVRNGVNLYGAGTEPMLWAKGTSSVFGLHDGQLVEVTIPDGTVPMGLTGGSVVSSSGREPLWLTPLSGGPPKSVDLTGKKDQGRVIRRWIGMEGQRVIIAWSVPGDHRTTTVRLHETRTGRVTASTNAPWAAIEKAALVSSQDKRHPAFGPVFVAGNDVLVARNTAIQALGSSTRRFGLLDGITGLVNDRGAWNAFTPGTAVPVGFGPGGEAIIRVSGRVYSVPLAK